MNIARKPKLAAAPKTPNIPSLLERELGPIVYRDIESLTSYRNNPRVHPERQIVQLMASVSEFGLVMPILVDSDDVIIAGHARLEAARRLGIKRVPVLVAAYLSAAQVRAYRLADNRLAQLSTWSEEMLAIEISEIIRIAEVPIEVMGWSTGEIDVLTAIDAVSDAPDAAAVQPALPINPVARAGDLWMLRDHRLLCASSLESASWHALMAGKTAAMMFTDAPYNVPIAGHVSGLGKVQHAEFAMANGEMSADQFIAFNVTYLQNAVAHLKPGAVIMACMDHRHIAELIAAARRVGLAHLNLCVWNKSNAGMGSLYRSKHELVLVLKHGTLPHTNNVELGKHGRYRTNVWDYPGVNSFGSTRAQDLADHPTVKPVALVADAIRDVTRHGEIVIDAFSGSGTTILACERTQRVGYAIEIEPGYVDVAIRRWEEVSGGTARLAATDQTFLETKAERAPNIDDACDGEC